MAMSNSTKSNLRYLMVSMLSAVRLTPCQDAVLRTREPSATDHLKGCICVADLLNSTARENTFSQYLCSLLVPVLLGCCVCQRDKYELHNNPWAGDEEPAPDPWEDDAACGLDFDDIYGIW